MRNPGRSDTNSRRSARIAVQPARQASAPAPIDEDDDEQSMDMDVDPTPSSTGRRKYDVEEEDYGSQPASGGRKRSTAASSSRKIGNAPAKVTGAKKQPKKVTGNDMGVLVPRDEMLQNTLLYLLLLQHKKIPAKKSDIIKNAMNGQTRDFEDVFNELEKLLNQTFGMKVIGVGETQKSGLFSNYILVSNYNLSVCDRVTPRNQDIDCRRSILFLILTVIFMLNRSIDEELVWKIILETKLNSIIAVGEKKLEKDNLRRFLKLEYVSTMYLNFEENTENDPPIVRYSWGPRADKEFSKYSILKFVAKQFPGKKPIDFTIQYGIAKDMEGELVAADAAIEERETDEGAENIPPDSLGIEGSYIDDDDLMSQQCQLGDLNFDDDEGLPQAEDTNDALSRLWKLWEVGMAMLSYQMSSQP